MPDVWQHDLFEGAVTQSRGGFTTLNANNKNVNLLISNLDWGVSDSDIVVSTMLNLFN